MGPTRMERISALYAKLCVSFLLSIWPVHCPEQMGHSKVLASAATVGLKYDTGPY